MCQPLIHVSSKPIKFCFSVPISLPRPFPRPTGSMILLSLSQTDWVSAKAISLSWLLKGPWSVVGGSGDEEDERLWPDTISLETRGHPAWATACHCEKWHHPLLRIVRARRRRHGARHTHRHWWRGTYARRRLPCKDRNTLRHIKMPWDKHRHKTMDSQMSAHTCSRQYRCECGTFKSFTDTHFHYRRARRACTGLYEGVSLLDDRIYSNTAALSTDRLGGQIATINHHLSADLQATHDSLQGPLGRYCTLFLSDSLYSSLTGSVSGSQPLFLSVEHAASLSAPDQTLSQVAVWETSEMPASARS